MFRGIILGLVVLLAAGSSRASATAGDDIAGVVVDSASNKPLPGGEVRILQGARVVVVTTTDEFGRFIVHNLAPGVYTISARYLGYRPADRAYTLDSQAPTTVLTFALAPSPVNLEAISVTASVPLAVDTRTGDQIFKQNDYHGAPTNTTSQILQQSIAGAARAPTGEVHIRGQHAEYTYYVDGIPVPSGISGSLNELFDPNVVNQIDFQTGAWDAEYGNKNAAIVNVTTRIPTGALHVDASSYVGSFGASGEALSLSRNVGKFGFFLSGTGQVTDMRREPVVLDTLTGAAVNFHNHGADLFGFGKVQWVPTDRDVVNLDVSRSRTSFQVPFDSTGGASVDDHQQDLNGFVNLGWRHRTAGQDVEEANEVFLGAFYRDGSLRYTPGALDQPSFIFYPDTTTPYNLQEDRNFHTAGLKADYTIRPQHGLEFKAGALAQFTGGHEDFSTTDSAGHPGPAANSGLNGSDVGGYVQTAIAPSDRWEIRAGARYDNHKAPFAGNQHQLSPRIKLSFFPDPANTFWVYYGRLFLPTNVEDLRAITSDAQGGVAAEPTLPERDHFFEVGFVHRYPFGVVTKLSAYHKQSDPGIDDNTVPGSAITTSVNIQHVRITGIEGVVELRPPGPVSGYLNVALNHAYGYGTVTGGFFPGHPPAGAFDLDHDQRLSGVANL
ncbi:MAG TPA: TonB-dependent receptor, partial [Gemmatimonadales bacterium]|nr:TonB-dependent receptor [Gemmatimonadales bacterium]